MCDACQASEPVLPLLTGHVLRDARLAARLTVRGLARRVERRHSVVSRWESGGLEPTLLDLDRLGRVLGVPLGILLETRGPGRRRSSRSHSPRRREALGAAVEHARLEAGLGFREVVRATGVSGRRIRALERGRDLALGDLRAVLAAIGVSPERLIARPGAGVDTRPLPYRRPVESRIAPLEGGRGASRTGVAGPPDCQIPNGVVHIIQDMDTVLGPLAA